MMPGLVFAVRSLKDLAVAAHGCSFPLSLILKTKGGIMQM